MAGLKELRGRLESIKSTQKITSAMKLVAASRLRKAQLMLDRSRCYSDLLNTAVKRILAALKQTEVEKNITFLMPELLRQKLNPEHYLLFVFSSDRGLAGSYNQNVGKAAVKRIEELQKQNKKVQIICYGKKVYDILKKKHAAIIIENHQAIAPKGLSYQEAIEMAKKIGACCQSGTCDITELIYSRFHSALNREIVSEQVYPLSPEVSEITSDDDALLKIGDAFYDYKPNLLELLENILPKLVVDKIFTAMINSQASEQGARMAAMENATNNAKDIISDLTLRYNTLRQSAITTELTEIIAGAEAI